MRESKPTIYDPNFLPNMIYSGVPSWLNLSVIENDEDLKKIDAAVVGVPWEGGCTIGGYSSTTEGPKAVRSTSIRYTGFLPDYNLDCFDYLKVADSGDVATQNGNYDFTFKSIRERIGKLADAKIIPITIGGDHGITYPIISEIAKRYPKKVGVLHFDAHLDNYSHFGDDELSRCSPFYRVYNDPNMDPTKIAHIGIRGPRNHREEYNNAMKYGATVIRAIDVHEDGWKASISKALEVVSKDTEYIYITVCADSLDAANMPQAPQDMGGLTSYELLMMLHEAGLAGAKGIDFVETYPEVFTLQTAAHVVNWAFLYYLNGLAQHIKESK